MANFTTVSDNGQVEIDWNALELTEEQILFVKAGVQRLIDNGKKLVSYERDEDTIEFHLKDERYFKGELIYGSYTRVTYFADGSDEIYFDTFGRSDFEKFGYVKEGK